MTNNKIQLSGQIPLELAGLRADQALAKLFSQYSRTQWQTWIREGAVMLDKNILCNIREKVIVNQQVTLSVTLIPNERWTGQAIPLTIIYEDNTLIIVNKPAGLVVHPGAGVPDHTLVNALIHHDPNLATVPRAGVIHRLDKDTSGLLLIARSLESHQALIQQMKARVIKREYEAIVNGVMISGGRIETHMGRHPHHRTRMAVTKEGRIAITHYRVIEQFRAHTHIRVQLETGRTHQIRVHMAHIHYPLVGDRVYGKTIIPSTLTKSLQTALHAFKRQALHAAQLTFNHPITQQSMTCQAPLPEDMASLLQLLKGDRRASNS